MQGYRDDGVVLRTQKLGEADRIITLLTRQNGRVRAVAKGVRRTKSRFGARLEPFTHVDVLIHPGRSLDIITQAEVIRAYGAPLVADYPKYTAGIAMLETAEKFTPVEKEPAIRQFLLLIGGLRALGDSVDAVPDYASASDDASPSDGASAPDDASPSDGASAPDDAAETSSPRDLDDSAEGSRQFPQPSQPPPPSTQPSQPSQLAREPRMVLDAYLLRSLAFAGYAPALEECARCSAPAGEKRLVAFAVAAGGMVCSDCRVAGAASPAAATVALMVALLRGDWLAATRSEHRHRVECSGLVAAYLQWHLEHSIRSLRHVERA